MTFKYKTTTIPCPICNIGIKVKSSIPYIPRESADIIGPGSRNIATERDRKVDSYFCDSCGLLFDIAVIQEKLKAKGISIFGIEED